MARQLGWIPPTPAYLLKMARAKRRAKRSWPSPQRARRPGRLRRGLKSRPGSRTRPPSTETPATWAESAAGANVPCHGTSHPVGDPRTRTRARWRVPRPGAGPTRRDGIAAAHRHLRWPARDRRAALTGL